MLLLGILAVVIVLWLLLAPRYCPWCEAKEDGLAGNYCDYCGRPM